MRKLITVVFYFLFIASISYAESLPNPVAYWTAEPGRQRSDMSGNENFLSEKHYINLPTIETESPISGEGSYSFLGDWGYYGKNFYILHDLSNFSELSSNFPCKHGSTNKSFSISVKIKPSSITGDAALICKWTTTEESSFKLFITESGNLTFNQKYANDNANSFESWNISSVSAGNTYTISLSYNDETKSGVAIVNGTTYTHNFTNNITVSNAPLTIGMCLRNSNHDGSEYDFYAGLMDDILFFDVALAEEQLIGLGISSPRSKPPYLNDTRIIYRTNFENTPNICEDQPLYYFSETPDTYYSESSKYMFRGWDFNNCSVATDGVDTKFTGEILANHGRNGSTGMVRWVRNYRGVGDDYAGLGGYDNCMSTHLSTGQENPYGKHREIWSRWWQKMPSEYNVISHVPGKYQGDRIRTKGLTEMDMLLLNGASNNTGILTSPANALYNLPSATISTETALFDTDGQWHCYEIGTKLSTTGNNDGYIRMYKDGVKLILDGGAVDLDGFNMGANTSDPQTYINSYMAPGFGNAFQVEDGHQTYIELNLPTDNFYPVEYDDYVVSTERVGCADVTLPDYNAKLQKASGHGGGIQKTLGHTGGFN